mgnify:FL=1
MITTGFIFYIILDVISDLREEKKKEHVRNDASKQEIFQKYVSYYQERNIMKT